MPNTEASSVPRVRQQVACDGVQLVWRTDSAVREPGTEARLSVDGVAVQKRGLEYVHATRPHYVMAVQAPVTRSKLQFTSEKALRNLVHGMYVMRPRGARPAS